jgi:hypothetical protein
MAECVPLQHYWRDGSGWHEGTVIWCGQRKYSLKLERHILTIHLRQCGMAACEWNYDIKEKHCVTEISQDLAKNKRDTMRI